MSELTPEEREKIYQEEKVRSEAQQRIVQEQNTKQLKIVGKGCLIVFTVFAGLIIFLCIIGSCDSEKTTTKSVPEKEEERVEDLASPFPADFFKDEQPFQLRSPTEGFNARIPLFKDRFAARQCTNRVLEKDRNIDEDDPCGKKLIGFAWYNAWVKFLDDSHTDVTHVELEPPLRYGLNSQYAWVLEEYVFPSHAP